MVGTMNEKPDRVREILRDAMEGGHAAFCAARKGLPDQGWIEDGDCDCFLRQARDFFSAGSETGGGVDANLGSTRTGGSPACPDGDMLGS